MTFIVGVPLHRLLHFEATTTEGESGVYSSLNPESFSSVIGKELSSTWMTTAQAGVRRGVEGDSADRLMPNRPQIYLLVRLV